MFDFSIWCAVSGASQVKRKTAEGEEEDKESLGNQERACVQAGGVKGWRDTGLRYIVPGQSRTRYVNLIDAENDIPPLHAMLEDAKAGKFNLLIVYDYNRLRNLMKLVKKVLENYGVQIYSVNQGTELQPPDEFRPELSDTSNIMMGMSEMYSDMQVADLRRKYDKYVPQRMDRGLPPLKIPWGYVRPPGGDAQSVPIVVLAQAAIIREIVDLFLGGMSYHELQAHLIYMNYPTPSGRATWSRSTIKKIIRNPYYAGKLRWQDRLTVRDFRDNTSRLVRNPSPTLKDGKHEALYSWETYQLIMLEVERRAAGPRLNVYPLTGLLECSVCEKRIYHKYNYWWCKSGHVKIRHELAMHIVSKAIADALKNVNVETAEMSPPRNTTLPLEELEVKRRKIQADYESEIYTKAEAVERLNAIKAQRKKIKDAELLGIRKQQEQKAFAATLSQMQSIPDVAKWINSADVPAVNAWLLRLCRGVVITPEHKASVNFRT